MVLSGGGRVSGDTAEVEHVFVPYGSSIPPGAQMSTYTASGIERNAGEMV